jgi:hypothetical protein
MIYSKGPIAFREYAEEKQKKAKQIKRERIEIKGFFEKRKESEAKLSDKWKKDFAKYIYTFTNITIIGSNRSSMSSNWSRIKRRRQR